jgi:hypothetical protein
MRRLFVTLARDIFQYLLKDGEVVLMCQKSFYSIPTEDRERAQQFMAATYSFVMLNYKAINIMLDNRINITQASA